MRIKKITIFIILILLVSTSSFAQNNADIPITKIKITNNVTLYKTGETGVYSNMIAVKTQKGVVVFDSHQFPEVAKKIREMIEQEFGKNIVYLISTHGANDHTLGNCVFSDVPIIANEEVKAEMLRWNDYINNPKFAQRAQDGIQKVAKLRDNYPGNPKELDEEIERTKRSIAAIKTASTPVLPTITFGDQKALDMGNTTFYMYHNTPSYSKSDIIIHIPEENVLIVGDIFNKNRLPWLNIKTDFDAMKKLFSKFIADDSKIKVFIGTHNYQMDVNDIRENFIYIDKLREEVARLHKEGKSPNDLMKELPLNNFPIFSNFNPYFYGNPFNMHFINIMAIRQQLELTNK